MSEIDKNDKEYKDFTEEEIKEYNANGFCAHPKIENSSSISWCIYEFCNRIFSIFNLFFNKRFFH